MREIIKNTEVSLEEIKQWRNDEEVPLMTAKHNAKVSKLLNELYIIQDDLDLNTKIEAKIAALIDILIRGINFKEMER